MEFTLLSSTGLTFAHWGNSQDKTMTIKTSKISVDKLECVSGSSCLTSEALLTRLEGLLLAQPSREGKRQRLRQAIDSRLAVQIFYGPLSAAVPNRKHTGYLRIDDANETDGLFKRLVGVCGNRTNIQARVDLEFGTKDEDKMKLKFEGPMILSGSVFLLSKYFDFPEALSQAWSITQTKFTGTLSLTLKLNDKALNLIYGGSVEVGHLVNRKLLDNAKESGDGIIVVENGKEVPCHKVFLTAHSDVFRAMFNSDMKEGKSSRVTILDMSEKGVKAVLAYLYCCDIQEALSNSFTAVELLRAADKYGIDKLFETMKDVILGMGLDWFSVDAAVHLFTLAKNKADAADFKEMGEKAKLLLKSKPFNELKKCGEFRELFDNSNNAMETWSFFMQK